jgi:hypothetical protein
MVPMAPASVHVDAGQLYVVITLQVVDLTHPLGQLPRPGRGQTPRQAEGVLTSDSWATLEKRGSGAGNGGVHVGQIIQPQAGKLTRDQLAELDWESAVSTAVVGSPELVAGGA